MQSIKAICLNIPRIFFGLVLIGASCGCFYVVYQIGSENWNFAGGEIYYDSILEIKYKHSYYDYSCQIEFELANISCNTIETSRNISLSGTCCLQYYVPETGQQECLLCNYVYNNASQFTFVSGYNDGNEYGDYGIFISRTTDITCKGTISDVTSCFTEFIKNYKSNTVYCWNGNGQYENNERMCSTHDGSDKWGWIVFVILVISAIAISLIVGAARIIFSTITSYQPLIEEEIPEQEMPTINP